MSSEKKEKLSAFMTKKNAESKGQKFHKKKEAEEKGDFLPERERPTKKTIEAPVRRNEGLLLLNKIIHILVMIPVIAVGVASVSYFAIKILPPVVWFIRKLFIILMMGQ